MSWRQKLCSKCRGSNSKDLDKKLLDSTIRGCVRCVNVLFEAGADVNIQDASALTPLVWAAKNGHVDCVRRLIKAGADVNISNKCRHTPIIYAAMYGHLSCLKLLIEAEADVNKQDTQGYTALIYSVKKEKDEFVGVLIKAGADVNLKDKYGTPTLQYASTSDNLTNVWLLLEAGADANQVNKDGQTALMLAKKIEYMKLLIDAGADVNVIDDDGNIALTLAAKVHLKFVRLLLRSGAKINMFTRISIINRRSHNALQTYLCKLLEMGINLDCLVPPHKTMVMLLFAVGEIMDGPIERDWHGHEIQITVPNFLLNKSLKLNLKHMCRETIRKHMINTDPHQHLFGRIPRLRLPKSITGYLLYNVSLDDNKQ